MSMQLTVDQVLDPIDASDGLGSASGRYVASAGMTSVVVKWRDVAANVVTATATLVPGTGTLDGPAVGVTGVVTAPGRWTVDGVDVSTLVPGPVLVLATATDTAGAKEFDAASTTVGIPKRFVTAAPWSTHADVRRLGRLFDPITDDVMDDFCWAAGDILYLLTGSRWAGIGRTEKLRPQAQWRQFDRPAWWQDASWMPTRSRGFSRYGWCSCNRGRDYGCNAIPEIMLPHGPWLSESIVVMIDGNQFDGWVLRDDVWLQRTDGNGWPCFPAGTLVLTETGMKTIETIAAGERVLTHRNRWRTVTRAGKTGDSETVLLKGRGGILRCTPDHPLWSAPLQDVQDNPHRSDWPQWKLGAPEWAEASTVVGDAWAMPTAIEALPIPLPGNRIAELLPADFWWIVGRWLGDGWTSKWGGPGSGRGTGSARIGLCCAHEEADEIESVLSRSGWKWRRSSDRTVERFRLGDRDLWSWLREHFGVGASNKQIPAWMFGAPEEIRRQFLDGYVSADGWTSERVGTRFVSARTVSPKLAQGVKLLAASLGYAPTMYDRPQTTTHIEGRAINGKHTYRVDWNVTEPRKQPQFWRTDGHVWGRVKSIEIDPTVVPVYDLEVEEDHSFVANGVVVHNCCQRTELPDTEQHTWSVSGSHGLGPDYGGVNASAILGHELALGSIESDDCRLPDRIQHLVRGGTTVDLSSTVSLFGAGMTGITEVDLWLASKDLGTKKKPATIRAVGKSPRYRSE